MFAVYKADTSQSGYSIWSVRLDSCNFIEMNSLFVRDLYGKNSYSHGSEGSPKLNFLKHYWSDQKIDTSYNHLFVCGGDSITSFKGAIAEMLFYNNSLSYKDITRVSTYLAIKYGISLSDINYIRSDNAVIWDVKKNKEFNNEIAGIGKDLKLQINQKQSGGNGGDAILKITCNNRFYNWNKENSYEINDGDFLMWGDNGKNLLDFFTDTLSTDSTHYTDSTIYRTYLTNLSERRWLMRRTGKTANAIPTVVMLHAPDLARDTLKSITLIISRKANILFPADSCLFFTPDSTDSSGNFYFHNIHWDTDSSGSDAFTFQVNEVQQDQQSCLNRSLSANSPGNGGISSVDVFPNPSNGLVNVRVTLTEPENVSVMVQDESGRVVYKNQLYNKQDYLEKIQLNSKGVYFLNIETKEKKKHIKLVVQ